MTPLVSALTANGLSSEAIAQVLHFLDRFSGEWRPASRR